MVPGRVTAVAEGLAERGLATLRFQFPYMEQGGKRPDPPKLAQATIRAAVAEAVRIPARHPLIAGGKSFGGRMTSQAQATAPLPGVRGLAFLGFPLHPAGHPSQDRGRHLIDVRIPMLFLQGTRDTLATVDQIEPLRESLGERATLKLFEGADHSFRMPARTGRKDAQVWSDVLDALVAWTDVVGHTAFAHATVNHRRVDIPKEQGKFRTLQIPCIRDRVVQGALKLILEAIFEADF
ncbi:MAG: alpha/beta family hydrolase, partial [Rhodoplanes sp.]